MYQSHDRWIVSNVLAAAVPRLGIAMIPAIAVFGAMLAQGSDFQDAAKFCFALGTFFSLLILGWQYCVAEGEWQRVALRRRCGGCGYDLRESSNRCPECGTAIPSLDTTTNDIR